MSKVHDGRSRARDGAGGAATPTPGPTGPGGRIEGLEGLKEREAAAARRVRSAAPRERSGPIGISSGDFATPAVRKRTITRPRGVPALNAPATTPGPSPAPVAVEAQQLLHPAERTQQGAVPTDLVGPPAALPAAADDLHASAPDDSPFAAPGPVSDPVGEAAALAAEAAAVRALDSGPLTPPPELQVPGPTPPPEPKPTGETPPTEGAAPTLSAEEPASGPALEESAAAVATPPPAIEPAAAEPVAPVAAADLDIRTPTPLPNPGALPALRMGAESSSPRPEPVPFQAAPDLPAEAFEPTPGEGDLDGEDHLEVVEGGDGSDVLADAEGGYVSASTLDGAPSPAPPRSSRTPTLKHVTPPPIPGGVYLKTPTPEPLVSVLPILPEALSQRPRRPKRSKPWFEEVFDEDYLRTLPLLRPEQTLREVEFISDSLRLAAGHEVLDVACGYGRHAIELVQRGINVTGLDLSLPLLIRAADEAQRRALSVNFVHADMREMAFERQFDGAYCMLTSFGYFEEDVNLRVAERIARALKPGGRFLLDLINRDYLISDLPARVWWEGTGCVVLEEVDFNFHTSRILTHRSIVFEDGRQLEQEISVRAYSLHEIGRLLRQAGFKVLDVSGGLATRGQFFGNSSRNLFVLAERREDEGT